jgi:tRNA threonylcarbamoyladenosine biosynthesis protein TsaE
VEKLTFISRSPEETKEIASSVASKFREKKLFLLFGELGSGKTLFVKGASKVFGVPEDEITSPTFSIIQEYYGKEKNIAHVDLYRIDREEDLADVLNFIYEKISEGNYVVFVEWAEKLDKKYYEDESYVIIKIKILEKDNEREINITALNA